MLQKLLPCLLLSSFITGGSHFAFSSPTVEELEKELTQAYQNSLNPDLSDKWRIIKQEYKQYDEQNWDGARYYSKSPNAKEIEQKLQESISHVTAQNAVKYVKPDKDSPKNSHYIVTLHHQDIMPTGMGALCEIYQKKIVHELQR